jgi:hypothetical protein
MPGRVRYSIIGRLKKAVLDRGFQGVQRFAPETHQGAGLGRKEQKHGMLRIGRQRLLHVVQRLFSPLQLGTGTHRMHLLAALTAVACCFSVSPFISPP